MCSIWKALTKRPEYDEQNKGKQGWWGELEPHLSGSQHSLWLYWDLSYACSLHPCTLTWTSSYCNHNKWLTSPKSMREADLHQHVRVIGFKSYQPNPSPETHLVLCAGSPSHSRALTYLLTYSKSWLSHEHLTLSHGTKSHCQRWQPVHTLVDPGHVFLSLLRAILVRR